MKTKHILYTAALSLLLAACGGNDFSPKPPAYLRIDMPGHSYARVAEAPAEEDSTLTALPFSFEIGNAATAVLKKNTRHEVWVDLRYPKWNGVVFLSYKRIHGKDELRGQLDTSSRYLEPQYRFASGIDERAYEDPEHKVYGTVWHIKGNKVASTYQFLCTDSTNHFLRGALFIDSPANNDSLAPVLQYLQADVDHFVETLRWK